MTDREELQRLAEDAIANRKHMVAVRTAASFRDAEMSEREFRAAASPVVVLELLDEIEALAPTGLRKLDADTIRALMDECDQLRAVAVRLRDALVYADKVTIWERTGARAGFQEELESLLADPEMEKL